MSPPPCSRRLALALTPVAVVIFRYNDPDAFLTLLLVLAAWACWRAIETGKTIGLVLSACARRAGLPHQDARRLHRGPGHRRRLPLVRPAAPGPAPRAARLGRARTARSRSGWWVAIVELWPKNRASLHRRQHGQLRAEPDLRLQRLRADLRLGWRRRRRRRRDVGRLVGLRRGRGAAPHVRQRSSVARSDGRCPSLWPVWPPVCG